MKNLRNTIIKMSIESINEIMEQHDVLSRNLVDGSSELIVPVNIDHIHSSPVSPESPQRTKLFEQQNILQPLNVPVVVPLETGHQHQNQSDIHLHSQSLSHRLLNDDSLLLDNGHVGPSSHDLTNTDDDVDDEVVTQTTVLSNDDGSADANGAQVVMMRTIIDGLSHSPVHESYSNNLHTNHGINIQQTDEQQPLLEQKHKMHQSQLASPVDFVNSDVTLDALSVGSSNCSLSTGSATATAQLITVKQDHKLVIVNHNYSENDTTNSSHKNIHKQIRDIGEYEINQQRQHCNHENNNRTLNVIDDLSADAIEITLNQHHHQQQEHHSYCDSNHLQHLTLSKQGQQQSPKHSVVQLPQTHLHANQQQQHHQLNHEHQLQEHHLHQSAEIEHHQHHETLSVIVQQSRDNDADDIDDDSHDSATQIVLSSPELSGVVGDSSLEPHSTYQTLTSVCHDERLSPTGFSSPSSSYATLTPLQPLPPISTMSDKFAYGSHITGNSVINDADTTNGNDNTVDNTANGGNSTVSNTGIEIDIGASANSPFTVCLPSHQRAHHSHHQQSTLVNSNNCLLNLNGLSGVQPNYNSYDKLPLINMPLSMSPPSTTHHFPQSHVHNQHHPQHHQYDTNNSPTHSLSGIVVTNCDLHGAVASSPDVCGGPLSPQSSYSHRTDLHSPTLIGTSRISSKILSLSVNSAAAGTQNDKQHTNGHIICLSPVNIADGSNLISSAEQVVIDGYESPVFGTHHRNLLVNVTAHTPSTSSSQSGGSRSSQLQIHLQQHSPTNTLSPHSVSVGSVSLHSPGGCNVINQNSTPTVMALPPINSEMTQFSAAPTGIGIKDELVKMVVALSPSSPNLPDQTLSGGILSNNRNAAATLIAMPRSIELKQLTQISHVQHNHHEIEQHEKLLITAHSMTNDNNNFKGQRQRNGATPVGIVCNTKQQKKSMQQQSQQLQINMPQHNNKIDSFSNNSCNSRENAEEAKANTDKSCNTIISSCSDMEDINTKELAQRISAELKRYSIPQAIFAQRVLCRSQGTLSDLLRNPKPWSKLKSGRETFRRMFKWLQEPEFQRMSALRVAAAQLPQRSSSAAIVNTCNNSGNNINSISETNPNTPSSHNIPNHTSMTVTRSSNTCISAITYRRKDEPHIEHMSQPKKPRLVFTDLQRRTLQAIFKETKRPSKEMQVTIARQLGLEPTTVGNFFMNARRRSMDKWRDDDNHKNGHATLSNNIDSNNIDSHTHQLHLQHISQQQHQNHQNDTPLSPLNQQGEDLNNDADMDLELSHGDFDLDDDEDEHNKHTVGIDNGDNIL